MHCNGCNISSYCSGVEEKLEPKATEVVERLEILRYIILRHNWDGALMELDRATRSAVQLREGITS